MTQLLEVSLDDKYVARQGRVFMTGIQALVRLPLDQRRLDEARGWATAGYVTGYRGSPLGGYDQQLVKAKRFLDAAGVIHQPGVNEDLAATACQGTQQLGLDGQAKAEGVFAIWYGKGPGVDRSGDAIRHGNLFGTAPKGGVLLLLGDDHICESSTTAHQSEYAMLDAMVPVLNPSGVQEILEYGLAGIALSRFSGTWVSLKCIHDTVESTASIELDPARTAFREPAGFVPPPGGLSLSIPKDLPWQPMAVEVERRLHVERLAAVKAWARENRLDRVVLGGTPHDRLGIVTLGKSWQDVVAALDELGIDEARAKVLGLRVYKPAMAWPLEPEALSEAVAGLPLVMVIEEKRPLVEGQIKDLLYPRRDRPVVIGKEDEEGQPLFPSWGSLDVTVIALVIARRLVDATGDAALTAMIPTLQARAAAARAVQPSLVRLPWFCPGCPHNRSTKVPEGSRAVGGIGCHFMATWMGRETVGFTQMGGEGASWLGEAPFTKTAHVFQNVGDGTFYHSGSLAIRAAKAAGVNITFKILFNDAVAMTGGQKMETANLDVPQIARLLEAEGVADIAVVADELGKYPPDARFPKGTTFFPREQLDLVQQRFRALPGVTAIVYDQTCAAEKRRRRKHDGYPDPDERIVINELVCEGCGDCGVASNCVAVQPAETAFGRKRRIDQSACNKDFSCVEGFCPSFVSVRGGKLRRSSVGAEETPFPVLPDPVLPTLDAPYPMVVTGIGGTGVITIAALLGMAAHLEGKGFVALDMLGLAQKGGAVVSYMKLAPTPGAIGSPRVAAGTARLLLACDMVVAAGRTALPTVGRGTTRIIANLEQTMTGAFTRDPDLAYPQATLERALAEAAGPGALDLLDASRLAAKLTGDAIGANLLLVGYAWQKGLIPLSAEAIDRAIELNGIAVPFNRAAFLWGRRAAHDPAAVERIAGLAAKRSEASLEALIEERAAFLEAYQDAAYAARYRRTVEAVVAAERRVKPGSPALGEAAARGLFKLMAYKDEYEVARLWTDGSFERQLAAEFASWDRLELHLAPPLLARRDPVTGHPRKSRFGAWIWRVMPYLARARRVRGTLLDPFGWTTERRAERRLVTEHETLLAEIARDLTVAKHGLAVELAALPLQIRGFGHVKMANLAKARVQRAELLVAWKKTPAALPPMRAAA